MRRLVSFAAATAGMVGLLAGSAGAAPVGAKKAEVLQTSCGAVVLNSANGNSDNVNALWAPAHFLNSNKVFTPYALNLTLVFTPVGGPPQTQTTNVSKNAPTKALTTCTFDQTDTAPDGSTFRIAGSATGLIR